MKEEWKVIKEAINAPNYEISNFGRVRNVKTGKVLKISYKHKTPVVNIPTTQTTHPVVYRLVAKYFLGAKGSFRVSYKDGDWTNLRADNLIVSSVEICQSNTCYSCYNKRTGELIAFKKQKEVNKAYKISAKGFHQLKEQLKVKNIEFKKISESEYYQINKEALRERKARTRNMILEFTDYVTKKYGKDWYVNNQINTDPVCQKHWKYMRTVH